MKVKRKEAVVDGPNCKSGERAMADLNLDDTKTQNQVSESGEEASGGG